jgi:hypothetical protein
MRGIKQQTINTLFEVLEKKKCIELSLLNDSNSTFNELISIELDNLVKTIDEARKSIKQDNKKFNIVQLRAQNEELAAYIRKLQSGFANLCKNTNNKCNCKENE